MQKNTPALLVLIHSSDCQSTSKTGMITIVICTQDKERTEEIYKNKYFLHLKRVILA